jgi:hypothetical protein
VYPSSGVQTIFTYGVCLEDLTYGEPTLKADSLYTTTPSE